MRKLEITMLTPAHDTGFSNLKDQLDASLDSLIGQQSPLNAEMLSAEPMLTLPAHGYEWQNWAGNPHWPGNETYLGASNKGNTVYNYHASHEVQTFNRNVTVNDFHSEGDVVRYRRDYNISYKFELTGDGDFTMEGFREYVVRDVTIPLDIVGKLPFQFVGNSGNNTFTMYYGENTVHMGAGGNNLADIRGGVSTVIAGAGDDTVKITNDWLNPGHPGNWSSSSVDLSAGGSNLVEVSGNTSTSGLTIATITLGNDEDTVLAKQASHVIIKGEDSTGNHTITLNGTQGGTGTVYTGRGETNLTALHGNYDIYLGDGLNIVDLSNWIGTSITVTFGSGIDIVLAHQHGMVIDMTGSNGGATLSMGLGQDQILIDDPSVSAPGIVYDFDFEQDSVTFGLDTDMMDLLKAGILVFDEFQVENGIYAASLYNAEAYILTQSDGTELLVDAGTVWSTFGFF